MSDSGATFYLAAAYGVAALLLVAEVCSLVRRSRAAAAAAQPSRPRDER